MAEKSYLDQFAKVISDMLDIDVLIVDKNLNLLGKCLVYYDLYQKIASLYYQKNALKTYKPKIYQTISELRKIYDLPAQAKRSPKDQNL